MMRASARVPAVAVLLLTFVMVSAGCFHAPIGDIDGRSAWINIAVTVPVEGGSGNGSAQVLIPLPLDDQGDYPFLDTPRPLRGPSEELVLEGPRLVTWRDAGPDLITTSGVGMLVTLRPGNVAFTAERSYEEVDGQEIPFPPIAISFPAGERNDSTGDTPHYVWASQPNVSVDYTYAQESWIRCHDATVATPTSSTILSGVGVTGPDATTMWMMTRNLAADVTC